MRPLIFAFLLALVSPAAAVLLQPFFFASGDGPFHLFRLVEYESLWRQGILYPRWAPDFYFGYGYPVFNYYAPLAYYAALPFLLLGADPIVATKMVALVSLALSATGAYLYARLYVSRASAAVCAAAYTYAPYHMVTLYYRGDLAESFAMAWYPLILWSITRVMDTRRPWYAWWLVVSLGGLVLSHNLSALLFMPILVCYVVAKVAVGGYGLRDGGAVGASAGPTPPPGRTVSEGDSPWREPSAPTGTASGEDAARGEARRQAVSGGGQAPALRMGYEVAVVVGCVVVAAGVTAFFWLPATAETALISMHRLVEKIDYHAHFVGLGDILSLSPLQKYGSVFNADDALNHQLALWQGLLLVLGLVVLVLGWRGLARRWRTETAFHLVIAAVVLFVMTPASAWLWERVPVLALVQFPWRFLAFAALPAAVCGALAMESLGTRRSPVAAAVSIVAIVAASVLLLRPTQVSTHADALAPDEVLRYELTYGVIGTSIAGEYLPGNVANPPVSSPLALDQALSQDVPAVRASTNPATKVVTKSQHAYDRRYAISAPAETTLTLNLLSFPGWHARLDGGPTPLTTEKREGLAQVTVPPGEHELAVSFGETPLRLAADLVSLIFALGLGGGIFLLRVRSRGRKRAETYAINGAGSVRTDNGLDHLSEVNHRDHPGSCSQAHSIDCLSEPQRRISPLVVPAGSVAQQGHPSSLQRGDSSLRLRMTVKKLRIAVQKSTLTGRRPTTTSQSTTWTIQESAMTERGQLVETPTKLALWLVGAALLALTTVGLKIAQDRYYAVPSAVAAPTLVEFPSATLVGYALEGQGAQTNRQTGVNSGMPLAIRLFWQQTGAAAPGRAFARLTGRDQQTWAYGEAALPGGESAGAGPDEVRVELRPDGPVPPGVYRVEVGLISGAGPAPIREARVVELLPTAQAAQIGPLVLGQDRSPAGTTPTAGGQVANLEGTLFLKKAEVAVARAPWEPAGTVPNPIAVRAGGQLHIDVLWQLARGLPDEYTMTARLADEQGLLWGVKDTMPSARSYPISLWPAQAPVSDKMDMTIPTDTPPGLYRLQLEVLGPDHPLSVLDQDGTPVGPTVDLGQIRVEPANLVGQTTPLATAGSQSQEQNLTLIGKKLGSADVQPGDRLHVDLRWLARRAPNRNLDLRLILQGADGKSAFDETMPLTSQYPTSRWRDGEIVRGQYLLSLSARTTTGSATLRAQIVTRDGRQMLQEETLGTVQVKDRPRVFQASPRFPRADAFGGHIELIGYDLQASDAGSAGADAAVTAQAIAGNPFSVTLYWQAIDEMGTPYKVFVQLLDPSGRLAAQHDSPPRDGQMPTTGWQMGEVVSDTHAVQLPSSLSSGRYALIVGLYDPANGARLTLPDGTDFVRLMQVDVTGGTR